MDFAYASPYRKYGIDGEVVAEAVKGYLEDTQNKTCLILRVNKEPHGILAAICAPNMFNRYSICVENIWWIDPEYRNFKYSRLMLDAYEYWARTIKKAQIVQMVSLDDNLHNLYTRRGFVRAENAYIKEL